MPLTDAFVRSVKPTGQKQEFAHAKGLSLVVGKTGTKSWVMRYKRDGKSRRYTLGTYPNLKLRDADDLRGSLRQEMKRGVYPEPARSSHQASHRDTPASAGMTVSEAFAKYMAQRWGASDRENSEKRNRARWASFENDFEPVIGNEQVSGLTKRELQKLLRDKHESMLANGHTGRGIGNVHGLLSAFLKWCVANEDLTGLEANPIAGLPKIDNGGERDRWLDRNECRWVLAAIRSVGGAFAAPFELLIRAGCRKSDIFNLTPAKIVLDNEQLGPHLFIPATKNTQDFVVPLVPAMSKLLPELGGKAADEIIWPCSGESTSKVKDRIVAEVKRLAGREIGDWRPHDFRTTVGFYLDEFGIDDRVIEKILNHKEPNKAKRTYRRYGFYHEKKAALQQWNDLLDGLAAKVEPEQAAA